MRIGNVRDEIQELIEERDDSLEQLRSANNTAGAVNNVNRTADDMMQVLELLMLQEAHAQDKING